jgi:hypothetical protein
MAEIRLAIEGEDAIAATEAFLEIPGISGNYKVNAEAPEREGVVGMMLLLLVLSGERSPLLNKSASGIKSIKPNSLVKKLKRC